MLNYLVVEISGRQYKVTPETVLTVDFLGEGLETFECDKVLLRSDDGKLEVGTPFLKDKYTFDVVGVNREKKIRVATYKAKANTRKVRGSRRIVSKIKLHV